MYDSASMWVMLDDELSVWEYDLSLPFSTWVEHVVELDFEVLRSCWTTQIRLHLNIVSQR